MTVLPKSVSEIIEALHVLPGVGQRSAERFAYYLLKSDPVKSNRLAHALSTLHEDISYCPITYALIDRSEQISSLYSDPKRDKKVVAIVEDVFDVVALENTGQFNGTYHVLGGLISPIDGINPESLHIPELKKRVKNDNVEEVILAISTSVEGESTAHYIQTFLAECDCRISRLARGLPMGLELEYADQITLGRALEGRQQF